MTSNWNLDPPNGFQGLNQDKPLTTYSRHLPHLRQDGATYLVTFRLADSLPATKLEELDSYRRQVMAEYEVSRIQELPNTACDELMREQLARVEKWLDQGMGDCHLRKPQIAEVVVKALNHFDGDSYELGCYTIMPNHVHLIIRPTQPQQAALERILQSRKRRSAEQINRMLGRTGALWQSESFDRIIRDEEHLFRCIQYIGNNAKNAGLDANKVPRWIRPEWEQAGWRFDAVL